MEWVQQEWKECINKKTANYCNNPNYKNVTKNPEFSFEMQQKIYKKVNEQ